MLYWKRRATKNHVNVITPTEIYELLNKKGSTIQPNKLTPIVNSGTTHKDSNNNQAKTKRLI